MKAYDLYLKALEESAVDTIHGAVDFSMNKARPLATTRSSSVRR